MQDCSVYCVITCVLGNPVILPEPFVTTFPLVISAWSLKAVTPFNVAQYFGIVPPPPSKSLLCCPWQWRGESCRCEMVLQNCSYIALHAFSFDYELLANWQFFHFVTGVVCSSQGAPSRSSDLLVCLQSREAARNTFTVQHGPPAWCCFDDDDALCYLFKFPRWKAQSWRGRRQNYFYARNAKP